MNMSYCRFQNTLDDLKDCQNALNAMMDGETCEDEIEEKARVALIKLCGAIHEVYASTVEE